MISIIGQVPSGGALRLVMQPQDGASAIRVTRGATQAELVDENAGTKVYEDTALSFLDGPGLVNGQTYWYRAFYRVGSSWLPSTPVSQTPVAAFADYSTDPMAMLRDAMSSGFVELVRRFTAGDATPGPKLNPKSGTIGVLFGTPAFDGVEFPVVTMHMVEEADSERFLGELPFEDSAGESAEGWLSSYQISICAWSQNYDERHALRQAIKAIVIGNLPVFDAAGLINVSLRLSDQDDLQSYPAPMYQVLGTFTCKAPSVVGESLSVVESVSTSVNVNGDVYV